MPYSLILFDLDETLYPRAAGVMRRVTDRIAQYMVEKLGLAPDKAHELRKHFRGTYGTALRGLMQEGYVLDMEDYFTYVHDVPLDGVLFPDPAVKAMLMAMPLRRGVLTNSNIEHAERILEHIQLRECFERVVDIRALNFINKPDPRAYERTLAFFGAKPEETIFVEDSPINTAPAKAMGITTILIDCPPSPDADYAVPELADVGPLVSRLMAL
jgi:putative hydrolase of the HAD superfamily